MLERKEIIKYEGVLTFSDINELLNTLKEIMDKTSEKLVTYKKLIILMVEVLENIKKYIDSSIDNPVMVEKYPSYFLLSKEDENIFYLDARNIIKNSDIDTITKKIELVNSMDTNGLRAYYRQIIANGQFSIEGGAGLGFIELAKTTENKIGYSFDKIDDIYSNYSIKLMITI